MPPSTYRTETRRTHHIGAPTETHYNEAGDALHEFTPAQCKEDRNMQVNIREIPAHRVAFVRHTGCYKDVGQTWQQLMAWAGPKQLLGPDMKTFGMAWDDPAVTPEDKLRYDACLVVDDSIQPEGDVGIQKTHAGAYATTTHQGPYDQLQDVYLQLFKQWLPTSGKAPAAAPVIEMYLNNPQNTPQDKLLTQICIPLEPAR